jgi:hypothetical protein
MACQEAAAVVAKARKCRSREHAAIQARTLGEVKRVEPRSGRRCSWWTRQEENGHWVLIVTKAELQLESDIWGFRKGELRRRVFELVPSPPATSTAVQMGR